MKEIEVNFKINVKFIIKMLIVAGFLFFVTWTVANMIRHDRIDQGMIIYLNKVEAKLKLNKQPAPEPKQVEQAPKEDKKEGK